MNKATQNKTVPGQDMQGQGFAQSSNHDPVPPRKSFVKSVPAPDPNSAQQQAAKAKGHKDYLHARAQADADARIPLQQQHRDLIPQAGSRDDSLTGWWMEGVDSPSCAIVCEDLGAILVVALLGGSEWVLAAANREAIGVHAGRWLRFTGGQTAGGPYHGPPRSTPVGAARIARGADGDLQVHLPDGSERGFRRARFAR